MSTTANADAPQGALDPKDFKSFKVIKKEKVTHDTQLIRFELPEGQVSGMYTASCLVTRAPIGENGKNVIRPYTPISTPNTKGYLDMVVKAYPTGVMSKHICGLQVGDSLDLKGPIPKYPYQANIKKHIGMIAGGTGIAPMIQVINEILNNPADKTEITLVFANHTADDIILKKYIDDLAAKHANFHVHYVISKANLMGLFWKGKVGLVNQAMIKELLPPPSKDNLIMICGPPGMMKDVSGPKAPDFTQGEVSGYLKELGFDPSNVYKF
eukprot:CAMPEP_0175080778 /NCGR_PEP_ID=MMETSP0052_2-20121109/25734_1 /TAXON_ID=51329 ORGANISM="Polytomella parva, Strain SAG 63-3" /NCGR_SAMPLE_ID=MMETSP0052_2 /ASSEMBLY_ACC=CAM_ASM_000194 /LENGTH=268 /DNA_ID=CAMNT_0016351591 /DNA_START=96 /DNA_END=902 /DNA_ORIENTATION=-